jgi:hypothetical protein
MKKITPPVIFKASDGREFENEEAAKNYEALVEAKTQYQNARRHLGQLLAKSFKTADGYPFTFGLSNYYHVATPWNSLPHIITIDFWYRNWDYEDHADDQGSESTTFVILAVKDAYGNKSEYGVKYPINELYRDEKNAKRALVKAQAEWLAQRTKELDELAAKIGIKA